MKYFALIFFLIASISSTLALTVKNDKVKLEKLEDYNNCHFKKYPASYCQDALYDWVESHSDDAFSAAKLTRKRMFSRAAVPLFYRAQSLTQFNCEDEDLVLAIKNSYEAKTDSETIKQTLVIIFEKCAKTNLAKKVVDTLSLQTTDFKTACQPFKEKGLLNGVKKRACK